MPSTYTNNSGLEKPGSGEQDNVWGVTANSNYDIIDRSMNGSISLALTGSSSTLSTLDGVLSDGQYRVLNLTGSLAGTHTITISPNDAQKLYFVRNQTNQSVVFTQGSGGNTTVASGDSKMIYSNGAGSGAQVVDFTAELAMSSPAITGGTITGITDLAIADGGTGASDAATARTNLGLGTLATQPATNVSITGGTITGITDLAVADGGTGASDAATARTNLGAQATITGGATSITAANLTASRALEADASGKVAASTVTSTELSRLSGVTSSVQTQLDNRVTANADDTLAAGYNTTFVNDGSLASGTYTPTYVGGNMRRIQFTQPTGITFAAPTASGDYTLVVLVNSAVTIAPSLTGFTKVTGDTLSGTGNWLVYITKISTIVTANVVSMQ